MWSNEIIEVLIINYQQHENLYNVRNPLYLDRVKRSNSLFAICQELKKINKDITQEDIKKKIHTLRSTFIKETRQISGSKRSGVGADDVYVPKLWYFPLLEFLKPHCLVRKSESNISEESIPETDESDTSFEMGIEPSVISKAQPPCNKRKKSFNIEDRINNVKKLILAKSQEKSCYDWLGKQVVFQITKLKNEKIQNQAVWAIQEILKNSAIEDEETEPQTSTIIFSPQESSLHPFRPPSSSSSSSFTPIHPFRPSSSSLSEYRLTPDCTSQSSSSPVCSVDILQQSMIGVLEDEDF